MIYNYYFQCNFGYSNVLKLQSFQYDIIFLMLGLGSSWTFRTYFLPFATPPLTNKQLMDLNRQADDTRTI